MIDLIAAASIGGIVGFLICAVLTAGKVADATDDAALWEQSEQTASKHYDRASDAVGALQSRIERALACETPKAAHGVKKMARLLRGEEA